MNHTNIKEKIIVIDFGSQFTQLITRKVREIGAYSEIINYRKLNSSKIDQTVKEIILSGSPLTVTNKNKLDASIFKLKI